MPSLLFSLFCLLVLFSACAPPPLPVVAPPLPKELPREAPQVEPEQPLLEKVGWEALPGWRDDELDAAFETFRRGCRALRFRPLWREVCAEAVSLEAPGRDEVRRYFEDNFTPHRVAQPNGESSGLLTGYYVPDLQGSRTATGEYRYPLFGRPDDLLVIDLSDLYPELGNYRLRGRVENQRVIPYWDRAAIDGENRPLAGRELFWVADPVELFFLHIQGSGRILFKDGSSVLVNYADQNGHPYRSIGKYLLDIGAMNRDQMSMQNIRAWARDNPSQVDALLNQNPSYVFFRELDAGYTSPPGSLGVPLTAGRSLAVDPRFIPLGAPVFIASNWPNSSTPLQRLMVAQDTGGAIKGAVRGDFFWGMGDQAGQQAGRTKQRVNFWLLLPKSDKEAL